MPSLPTKARSSSSASSSGIRWRASPSNSCTTCSACGGSVTIRITSRIPAAGSTTRSSTISHPTPAAISPPSLPTLQAHGFGDRWAFRGNYPDGRCYGMTEQQILQLYREADAFLNVTGAQEMREEHMACPRRIYVETDPVAAQIKIAQGNQETIAALSAHEVHFSFGENFGAPDCKVPLKRFQLDSHAPARHLGSCGAIPLRRMADPTRPSPPGKTRARTSSMTARRITGRRTASS